MDIKDEVESLYNFGLTEKEINGYIDFFYNKKKFNISYIPINYIRKIINKLQIKLIKIKNHIWEAL